MLFRDIIGQEATKQKLRQAVREGRIPHAQLFTGIAGIGKLQLALAYSQYLNCPNRTEEDSCGACPTCLQWGRLQHPDLHFVFPIVKTDAGDTCDAYLEPWREIILNKHYFDLDDWHSALGIETKQSMIYEKESGEIRNVTDSPVGMNTVLPAVRLSGSCVPSPSACTPSGAAFSLPVSLSLDTS